MPLPADVSVSLTALGASGTLRVPAGRTMTYAITGTWVGTVRIVRSRDGGQTWTPVTADLTGNVSATRLEGEGLYKLECVAYTSGMITGTLSLLAATLRELRNPYGGKVQEITDEKVAVAAHEIGEVGYGTEFKVIDEIVDLTAAGAKFVAMANSIPAGAVIISAQMNIQEAVVAGGTSVKVGLGDHSGTCNTWGNTSVLTLNAKAKALAAYSVLAAQTTPEVCACASTATGLGNTNFSAGKVRVRIVYIKANDLPDA